ncbi:thymidine phosphorylase [Mesomycoplasma moatsii]|uniref:thymidine phosphorylase n=1 Tax=Mesomycoplasma moatsii TaxID=171287 RepID=UPI0003B441EA
MNILEIIEKKKNKEALSQKEIEFFVDGYTKNKIPDYQMSALLMTIVINGMNDVETAYLTEAMMNSGKKINLSSIKGIKVDKHSTGGVGDKVSLVLGPIVAACGAVFAKMSGRGLGYTGGTIDKLESIEGFNCFLNEQQFKFLLKKSNIAIIGQTDNLVPADKKIYALRDVSGTVNSLPLITSSIMSKKLSTGSDAILLDVKCGSGAFMKNINEAKQLARWMINIGKKLKKDVRAEITNMEQPLGRMIGNKNEIIEVIESLKGNGDKKFMELIYSSATTLLIQAKIVKNEKEACKLIEEVIKSGKAFNKFLELIENQGGNIELIQKTNWWKPKYKLEINATKSGYLYLKNSVILGLVAVKLGAGRNKKEDIIDNEAGIELKKVTNEKVQKNEILMVLYSSKPIDKNLSNEVKKTFEINQKPKNNKIILAKME